MKKINLTIEQILGIAISLVAVISVVLLSINIININILPFKYLITILIILFILIILSSYFTFKDNKVLNLIGYLILGVIIIFSFIAGFYIRKTDDFLNDKFVNVINEYTKSFVIVSKKDIKLEDLKTLNGGYYKEIPNVKEAKVKLGLEPTEYDDLSKLINSLDKENDYMLLEKNLFDLIFDLDKSLNKEDYKIILTFELVIKEKVEKINETSNYNIYIGGVDFTGEIYDFNMLVSVNEKDHKVLLTSIPRDYHIPVAGKGGSDNISYHGVWGLNTTIDSLEQLLDININYYMRIDSRSLVDLVDRLGGIEYCSDEEYYTTHALVIDTYNDSLGPKLYVKQGCYNYSGIEILTIARERLNVTGGDTKRQSNCRKILLSIIDKLMTYNTLTKYEDILNDVSNLYTTNIDKKVVTNLIKDKLDNKTKWKIEEQGLTGTTSKGYVRLSNIYDYIMVPNDDSIAQISTNIKNLTK